MTRPRSTFWLLSLAMGASTVGQSMLATSVPLFAVALGLAPLWVGVLVALPNFLPVLLAMTAGRWIDRGGAGRWLAIGTGGMASAPLLLVLVPSAPALALAQLLLGVFQLFAALSSQSFVADLGGGRALERNYATYATLLSAGRLVGPLLAGVAIDAAGFRAAFGVVAAVAAFTFAVAWRIRGAVGAPGGERAGPEAATDGEEAAPEAEEDAAFRSPAGAVGRFGAREAFANVGVQLAVLSSAGVFVAISARQAFLPVALTALGYPATTIGALISLGALAAVAVRPLMPVVSRALGGPARTLVVAMVAVAIAVGALGMVTSLTAFALLGVLAGFGTGVGLPLSIVTVASHVDPRHRGTALGLRLSLNRAAQLAMPVVIGAVIGAAGFGVGFGLAGTLLAALAVAAASRVAAFERQAPRG
ncbi:MAG: MFS transporter [Trueperaceae bacterium]